MAANGRDSIPDRWHPRVAGLLGTVVFVRGRIGQRSDTAVSSSKYVVLMAALLVTIRWNDPRWAVPIRTGEFSNPVELTFAHTDGLWLYRTIFIVAGIAAAAAR